MYLSFTSIKITYLLTALILLLKTAGLNISYWNNCQRFAEFHHVVTFQALHGKPYAGKLSILLVFG